MPFEQAEAAGLARWIADDTLDRYIDANAVQSLARAGPAGQTLLKVAYTPLHGTGLECVTRIPCSRNAWVESRE